MKTWCVVLVMLCLSTCLFAQAPAAPVYPPGTPMANATTPSVGELLAQVEALKKQVAQKPAAPQMTPAERLAVTQKTLSTIYKNVKESALDPCRLAGGTLSITLTATVEVATFTCLLK